MILYTALVFAVATATDCRWHQAIAPGTDLVPAGHEAIRQGSALRQLV
jgi:hypothetical protein